MFSFIKKIFSGGEKLYTDVSVNDFKSAMTNNAIIVDVRTPQEYKQAKIKKAININVASFDFMNEAQNLDKNKDILVYCRSGARSARASKMLSKLGFTKVHNLLGGIGAWQNNGEKTV